MRTIYIIMFALSCITQAPYNLSCTGIAGDVLKTTHETPKLRAQEIERLCAEVRGVLVWGTERLTKDKVPVSDDENMTITVVKTPDFVVNNSPEVSEVRSLRNPEFKIKNPRQNQPFPDNGRGLDGAEVVAFCGEQQYFASLSDCPIVITEVLIQNLQDPELFQRIAKTLKDDSDDVRRDSLHKLAFKRVVLAHFGAGLWYFKPAKLYRHLTPEQRETLKGLGIINPDDSQG